MNTASVTDTVNERVLASASLMGDFCPNSPSRGADRSKYWCSMGPPRGLPAVSKGETATFTALMLLSWMFFSLSCPSTRPVSLSFWMAPAAIITGAPGQYRFSGRVNSLENLSLMAGAPYRSGRSSLTGTFPAPPVRMAWTSSTSWPKAYRG